MEKDTQSILNNVATSNASHIGEHIDAFDAFNAQDALNQLIATDAKGEAVAYLEWYLSNDDAWQLATTASPENPRKSIEYALVSNGYHWVAGDGSDDEPEGHWTVD